METTLVDHWRPAFRHSAGKLGSAFLLAARNEGKLLGWRSGRPTRVMVPPKDLGGQGEWVEVGPGASLLGVVPSDWSAGSGEAALDGYMLGRVLLDRADTPLLALLADTGSGAMPAKGARLVARFRRNGAGPYDFWFVAEGVV